jgi:hypothetical protein
VRARCAAIKNKSWNANVTLNPAVLGRDMAATLNSRHTETSASKGISTCEAGDATVWRGFGMKLAFIIALLFVTSPVTAQQATTADQQQQPLGAGGMIVTSPLTNTGTMCIEEMVATFCNVSTGPNTAGYGSNGGAAATSAGIATPSPAIPACGEGIVTDNELCN